MVDVVPMVMHGAGRLRGRRRDGTITEQSVGKVGAKILSIALPKGYFVYLLANYDQCFSELA